ncbi:MAG: protoporphyrinogen oxidase [Rhodothermales bacterium]
MPDSPAIAVIGGGISGLAAAWRLQALGGAVTLFEASDRTGGVIRSTRRDGFLVDEGPNTLVARSTVVTDTIEALGLASERVAANEVADARYVVRDGALVRIPTSPSGLLTTPLLSAWAKLRLLGEPFVRPHDGDDEALAAFVRRRLGPEVLDYAVNPFVAGVYAGDPAHLSTRHAFPMLHTLEREHGSLLRGMIHRVRNRADAAPKPSPHPFSFRGGAQALPDAFAGAIGPDAIRLRAPLVALRHDSSGWRVTTRTDDGTTNEDRFDGVVFTAPLHRLPAIDFEPDVDLGPLADVVYPPLSVLALGFRRADVVHALDGFGVLVPEREGLNVLGALFSSTLFPGRAPDGHVLLTCFVGGMRRPDLAPLPTDDLVPLALADLRALLDVRGKPVFVHRVLWERAIPQYQVGYGRVIETLDALEARHAGLAVAGNVRRGISVGDALEAGLDAAERVLNALP